MPSRSQAAASVNMLRTVMKRISMKILMSRGFFCTSIMQDTNSTYPATMPRRSMPRLSTYMPGREAVPLKKIPPAVVRTISPNTREPPMSSRLCNLSIPAPFRLPCSSLQIHYIMLLGHPEQFRFVPPGRACILSFPAAKKKAHADCPSGAACVC